MNGLLPSSCDLCPHECGLNRAAGEIGVCGASDDLVVARSALHMWEEPPVSGESGSGTIFFSHCPLHCCYCQNTVIAHGQTGRAVSLERLAEMCLELQEAGALNVNMVTPTHYAPYIRRAVSMARQRGLHLPIVWNTGGYESASAIRDNCGTVDVYLTDFKYASAELGERYSGVGDYPIRALEALDEMLRCVGPVRYDSYRDQERIVAGIIVRHLMLPGCLEDSKAVIALLHERYGSDIRLSIMNQYTPIVTSAAERGDLRAQSTLKRCPELALPVPDDEYMELLDFADDIGVDDYFWQEGGACEESFIPPFDCTGV